MIFCLISISGGHFDVTKVKDGIENMFLWPGVDKDVRDYSANCLTCAQINPSRVVKEECLRPTCLHKPSDLSQD